MKEVVGGAGQLTIYNNNTAFHSGFGPLPVVFESGAANSNPFANHFVGLGHGFAWTQFGAQTNSNFSSTWQVTENGMTTSDPETIKKFMALMSSYQQQKTDCVFQTMGFMSSMYGDQSRDSKFYQDAYNKLYGSASNSNPAANGVSTENMLDFMGRFFVTNNLNETVPNNIANWINPSNNLMGDNQLMGVYRTLSGGLHAVTVQSINGNYSNIYDPQNYYPQNNTPQIENSRMEQYYGVSGVCNE
jgi:hypothetical protein